MGTARVSTAKRSGQHAQYAAIEGSSGTAFFVGKYKYFRPVVLPTSNIIYQAAFNKFYRSCPERKLPPLRSSIATLSFADRGVRAALFPWLVVRAGPRISEFRPAGYFFRRQQGPTLFDSSLCAVFHLRYSALNTCSCLVREQTFRSIRRSLRQGEYDHTHLCLGRRLHVGCI